MIKLMAETATRNVKKRSRSSEVIIVVVVIKEMFLLRTSHFQVYCGIVPACVSSIIMLDNTSQDPGSRSLGHGGMGDLMSALSLDST